MCETEDDIIKEGQYVIVKHTSKYKKLYKVVPNGILRLQKNEVEMSEIIGKRFWSTFMLHPINGKKQAYRAKEVLQTESLNDLLDQLPSGSDNRSIIDDGTSQKLSKEEILRLQESGKSGKEIVGSLIQNNKSFLDRTEYSQEKYLKKKEQKYMKYITICRPTISLLHDSYFLLDHTKVSNLRMDTLAQFLSYSDVQSDGVYILYDSGTHGLPAAAMLNRIGNKTDGRLIHFYPKNMPTHNMVQAMNFPAEQLDRLIYVNIHTFLKLYHDGEGAVWQKAAQFCKKHENEKSNPRKKIRHTSTRESEINQKVYNESNLAETEVLGIGKEAENVTDMISNKDETSAPEAVGVNEPSDTVNIASENINETIKNTNVSLDTINESSKIVRAPMNIITEAETTNLPLDTVDIVPEVFNGLAIDTDKQNKVLEEHRTNRNLKRKLHDSEEDEIAESNVAKKPKWLLKAQDAVECIQSTKARGLAIVATEHPENIITTLLPFLGPSRPFVIYHAYKEPLEETYMTLKQKHKVINLKLFSSFLRSYQVLPDRTHPDITISGTGGYLLTGYLVED